MSSAPGVRVLAVDPALRKTGYAVLESSGDKVRALTYGTIVNRPALLPSGCLVSTHQRITELIEEFAPVEAAFEAVIFVQSLKTAITLGGARGAAILAVAQRGLPIYEYAPRRVKQGVVGTGAAQKGQVGFMVRALLSLKETPEPDAADALAIGLTHMQMSRTARRTTEDLQRI